MKPGGKNHFPLHPLPILTPSPESDNAAWKNPTEKDCSRKLLFGGQTVIFEYPETWSKKSTPSEEKRKHGPRKETRGDWVWRLRSSLKKLLLLEQINTVNICPVFLGQSLSLFIAPTTSTFLIALKASILSFYCLMAASFNGPPFHS